MSVVHLAPSGLSRAILAACVFAVALSAPPAALAQAPGSDAACPADPPAGAPGEAPAVVHVRWLADDALRGRAVGTPGERCSAAYLAERFRALGLTPAGAGGGWYQTFPVRAGSVLGTPGTLRVGGDALANGRSWSVYGFSGSGQAEGRLVYAGPGLSAPGTPDDRYTALDLTGAVAVVEAVTPEARGLRADPHFKASVVQGRGAAAVLLLLPEGAPLPAVEGEARPFVRIPVAAVSGAAAEAVRSAARAGAMGQVVTDVRPRMVDGMNVAALLLGTGPRAEDVVVVGAHFDHLGFGGEGSLAPDSREVHNGADDNASGTAGLLRIAERLAAGPPLERSVLFLAFGGEERGLLGSSWYVENPLRPLERTTAMLNLDMVGRLEDGALTVFGMATAEEWESLVRQAAATLPRPPALTLLPDGFGPSDHSAFYGKGVPVLHFFTGTHADYHRPSDDWQKVDGEGIERVAAIAAEVTTRLAGGGGSGPVALTPVTAAGGPHGGAAPAPGGSGGGYGPYFGSIPDMTPQDFGVRLTGVREDSPAARAGLQEGDVIVSFGGKDTGDLYAYTYALQDHAPGDRVQVVVVRDGQRLTLTAVLGERR